MKLIWKIDEDTVVEVQYGLFSKNYASVNGNKLPHTLTVRKKNDIAFVLPKERGAFLTIRPRFASQPIIELRVDGRMMVQSSKDTSICPSCAAAVESYDRFCNGCGKQMPTAEEYASKKEVKGATKTINMLALLFLISGIFMCFAVQSKLAPALLSLEKMDANFIYTDPTSGTNYTVAALKTQLLWQPWSALIINVILAAVMGALALWGKRAPLAALLVATATYAVVLVASAVIDPMTIGQAIFMKMIIIVFLVRGIKSALALRVRHA